MKTTYVVHIRFQNDKILIRRGNLRQKIAAVSSANYSHWMTYTGEGFRLYKMAQNGITSKAISRDQGPGEADYSTRTYPRTKRNVDWLLDIIPDLTENFSFDARQAVKEGLTVDVDIPLSPITPKSAHSHKGQYVYPHQKYNRMDEPLRLLPVLLKNGSLRHVDEGEMLQMYKDGASRGWTILTRRVAMTQTSLYTYDPDSGEVIKRLEPNGIVMMPVYDYAPYTSIIAVGALAVHLRIGWLDSWGIQNATWLREQVHEYEDSLLDAQNKDLAQGKKKDQRIQSAKKGKGRKKDDLNDEPSVNESTPGSQISKPDDLKITTECSTMGSKLFVAKHSPPVTVVTNITVATNVATPEPYF